jgi:hypothetical protein
MVKLKKLQLVIDGRESFIEKYAREFSLEFEVNNNILLIKQPNKHRNTEVGRIETITLDDYLHENNGISRKTVYDRKQINTIYKITLDHTTINNIYSENKCLTNEDLCLCHQYLVNNGKKAFYTICLVDPDDINDKLHKLYEKEMDNYDFVVLDNREVYPNTCDYKIIYEKSGTRQTNRIINNNTSVTVTSKPIKILRTKKTDTNDTNLPKSI